MQINGNRNVLEDCKGALGICYLCGRLAGYTPFGMMASLEWHHVLKEILDRKHGNKYGLKVRLHALACYRGRTGSVNKNFQVYREMVAAGQKT